MDEEEGAEERNEEEVEEGDGEFRRVEMFRQVLSSVLK